MNFETRNIRPKFALFVSKTSIGSIGRSASFKTELYFFTLTRSRTEYKRIQNLGRFLCIIEISSNDNSEDTVKSAKKDESSICSLSDDIVTD